MEPFQILRLIVIVCFLSALSLSDLKTRTVPVVPILLFSILSLLLRLLIPELSLKGGLIGALPGLILLIPALLPHSGIGSGDGLTAIACGCLLGFWPALYALLLSLILCGVLALFLLLLRRIGRRDALPFLPFLTAGHALLLLLEALS